VSARRYKANPSCPRCGETLATHTDLQVDDLGKVWDLTWLECIECFEYSTRPKRKYLGLEVEMWPDYTPDEDEPDPNPYRERGLSQSDF